MKKFLWPLLWLVIASNTFILQSCNDESTTEQIIDTDQDGIPDDIDNCVGLTNPAQADADGDGIGNACETDTDGDGVIDDADNCITTANHRQIDTDGDGIGDACEADTDRDNIIDDIDNCLNTSNTSQSDVDGDGIGDACDNCPLEANPNQEDVNRNGIGDACETLATAPLYTCDNGRAGPFTCKGYDLMANISLAKLDDAALANDCWGWKDPASDREFAIVGTDKNTSFIEITDPFNPIIIGFLPTATSNNQWRDVKVYNDHAFIVSEAQGHGMQVFDLTRLLTVESVPATFAPDTRYQNFGKAHNIVINEDSGFAYAVGSNTFGGGPHIVDISNPKSPRAAGGFSQGGYSHDAQVVIYNGPDADYSGKEILIGSNADKIVIADITDKNNITEISTATYDNIGYTHQGWFSEDQRYFFLGDELDEQNIGFNTRTLVFDFMDLDNPVLINTYYSTTPAIDHNMYVLGNELYQANYTAGIRVLDISDVNNISEVGYFDTHPANDNASFRGVWNVYPYFPSGLIIGSDMQRGLFILKKK